MVEKMMIGNSKNLLFKIVITGTCSVMITSCANTENTEPQVIKPVIAQNSVETPEKAPPPVVNYKYATLTNLNLDQQGNEIAVKPGRVINATLNYAYHCSNCNRNLSSQIIVGLARRSAQACIYNGGAENQGVASFELKVPAKPGKYDVRYRALQAADCAEALKAGWGNDNSPSSETTIGMIIASKKAES
jgi:hypothetical protein